MSLIHLVTIIHKITKMFDDFLEKAGGEILISHQKTR